MHLTGYPRVDELLNRLLPQLQSCLSQNLIGVYLYGSLVSGDYDDTLSDVDLLAALEHDLTGVELELLRVMHAEIVTALPAWDNRIEVAYLSRRALSTFKTERSIIGIISPGEPLHFRQAGIEWLMNWYRVREGNIPLLGPPPATLIPPISVEEYRNGVRNYLLRWHDYAPDADAHHGSLAYDVLTLCRGYYTVEKYEVLSKNKAAARAKVDFPEWAWLIDQALGWRSRMHEYNLFPRLPISEVSRFVRFMLDQLS